MTVAAHWDNEDDYRIHCGAYQESVYDEYEKINHAAFGDRDGRSDLEYILNGERIEDDSVFDPIYEELEKMICRELEAHEAIELLEG